MKRLIPWLAPLLLLIAALSYLLVPRWSLGFNQVCEMLATGNTRGLLMFFHEAGPQAFLLSLGIGFLAFLVPALKPDYLLQANVEFFGQPSGSLLAGLSGVMALGFLALLGFSICSMLPAHMRLRLKKIQHLHMALLLAGILWFVLRLY